MRRTDRRQSDAVPLPVCLTVLARGSIVIGRDEGTGAGVSSVPVNTIYQAVGIAVLPMTTRVAMRRIRNFFEL